MNYSMFVRFLWITIFNFARFFFFFLFFSFFDWLLNTVLLSFQSRFKWVLRFSKVESRASLNLIFLIVIITFSLSFSLAIRPPLFFIFKCHINQFKMWVFEFGALNHRDNHTYIHNTHTHTHTHQITRICLQSSTTTNKFQSIILITILFRCRVLLLLCPRCKHSSFNFNVHLHTCIVTLAHTKSFYQSIVINQLNYNNEDIA